MKKFLASIVILASAVLAAQAVSLVNAGPVEFKVTAFTQEQNFIAVSSKTNTTATSTNTTTVFKAIINKASFANSNFLALLANSFNTNFPAGSQVGMRFGQVFVVDSTGTNIIFNPSTVVTIQFDNLLNAGMETQVFSQKTTGFSFSGNLTELVMTSATLIYDDSTLTTGDATHTGFQFKGFMTLKESENFKNDGTKETIEFQGTGGGPIRGVATILTGTISAKLAGARPPA